MIATKSINFSDFDFTVDRSRIISAETYDGSVTIRMPGKNRKTANHELLVVPYFKKNKLSFKTIAIGKSKNKKFKDPIVVFDQSALTQQSALIRKYGKTNGFVNSKGHALKMLEIFNLSFPAKPNEVIKLYFTLHPTSVNGNKKNYRICTISLAKVIRNEQITNIVAAGKHSNKNSKTPKSKHITKRANAAPRKPAVSNIV